MIVGPLIASLAICSVMLVLMNIPLVKLFVKFLQIPNWVLVPGVAAVSMVGVYAVHGTTFDLIVGTLLGGFGYLLRVMNFPMAPFILGFVLGDMMGRTCAARCRSAMASSRSCSPARSRSACGWRRSRC